MRLDQTGVDPEGAPVRGGGLVRLAVGLQDGAVVVVRFRVVGPYLQGAPVGGPGFVEPFQPLLGKAEAVVHLGEAGRDPQGAAVCGYGLFGPLHPPQHVAQVGVGLGVVGLHGGHRLEKADRPVAGAHLVGDRRREVQRVHVGRLGDEDFLARPQRLVRAAALKFLDRPLQTSVGG